MHKIDWNERKWQLDVAAFANWASLLKRIVSPANREWILARMRELQERWPNHKLGDIPQL